MVTVAKCCETLYIYLFQIQWFIEIDVFLKELIKSSFEKGSIISETGERQPGRIGGERVQETRKESAKIEREMNPKT